jgi:hypothetical protein
MKIKKIIAGGMMLGMLASVNTVGAVTTSSTRTVKTSLASPSPMAKVADKKAQLQAQQQNRLKNLAVGHADRIERRFGFYKERSAKLLAKIETRIEKIKATGADTSKAEAKFDEAKAKLAEANRLANEAVKAFRNTNATTPQEQTAQIKTARELAFKARDAYKATSDTMKEVVALLKPLAVKPSVKPTAK